MYGIGVDTVEIERFARWHVYSEKTLLKLFSPAEIDYCRAEPLYSAQRFAVRFAAKEAAFKAITQATGKAPDSFFEWCKKVEVSLNPAPSIVIHDAQYAQFKLLCSLTHAKSIATAFVIVISSYSFSLQRD